MAPRQTSKVGLQGENFVVGHLSGKGYKIVERNFRSSFGEIDIIAKKDNKLIFIEVKTRWSLKFGRPEEAVNQSKLWKIAKTGEYYSMLHPELPKSLRIEVVAVEIIEGKLKAIRIIPVD